MAQRLYEIFRANRSIQFTAKQMNEEGFHTPSGAAFNASTTSCTVEKKASRNTLEKVKGIQ